MCYCTVVKPLASCYLIELNVKEMWGHYIVEFLGFVMISPSGYKSLIVPFDVGK